MATARVAHRRSALNRSPSPRVRLWVDDKRIGTLRPVFSVAPFGYLRCPALGRDAPPGLGAPLGLGAALGSGSPLGSGPGLGLDLGSGLGFGGLPGRSGPDP